jgi:hypothetical protein
MSAREFGEKPLYAGAVLRGVRSWSVSPAGFLHGLTYAQRWKPGENEAVCLSEAFYYGSGVDLCECGCGVAKDVTGRIIGGKATQKWRQVPHSVNTEDTCGYYALTDGSYPDSYTPRWSQTGTLLPVVAGLVEGYGTVVVGSCGFRAQKVRVAALVVPPDDYPEPQASWYDLTDEERVSRAKACPSRVVHLTHDLEYTSPNGVWADATTLARAASAPCKCLEGLAEETMQVRRAAEFGADDGRVPAHLFGPGTRRLPPVGVGVLATRYGVPTFPTMQAALEAYPIISGDSLATPTDNASPLPEVTASFVDPDSPVLGDE